VDIRQSPATRPLLFDARRACRLAEDPALGHKNDVTVGELLLKLASKPRMMHVREKAENHNRPKCHADRRVSIKWLCGHE
jgi:hypothetical protein